MKDISLSRHYLPALFYTSLLTLAALLPFTAEAQPLAGSTGAAISPYVGTASAKAMYRQYAIKQRQQEKHGSADALATPLAQIRTSRAAAMAHLNPHVTTSTNTVSSTVQTEDYTLPLEDVDSTGNDIAPANLMSTGANIDPAWFPDESFVCYSSVRSSDGLFHLIAIPATGIDTSDTTTSTKLAARQAQVSQMTTDTPAAPTNERWPSLVSATQIAYCQSTGANPAGPYSLVVAPILINATTNLPYVDQTHASVEVQASTTAGQIASVEHPVYVGDFIIFAAIKNGDSTYHLYQYTISNGATTQLTAGAADEENPSVVSTPDGQSVLVFDSTATGYPSNSTALPLTATGVSTTGQRNIFATTTTATLAVKVTDSATANSVEPSLGYVTANQAAGIGEGVHLFFSSNRIGGHYNIYDLPITIAGSGGSQAIVAGESPTNAANQVLTSDPQSTDSAATPTPVGAYDNLEVAAPPFITFNSVLYVSARYLVNNIDDNPVSNGALRYGTTPATTDFAGQITDTEMQPANTPANPAGVFQLAGAFPAETQTLNPSGSFEVMASHDADIDAPSLLRYSDNEVIHITTAADDLNDPIRQANPSQTLYFLVRLSDRQTGVGDAYLQIKDPNSRYQQNSGIEHKVYTKDGSVIEPGADARLHPYSNEATRLFGAGDITGNGAIGGYVGAQQPIFLGNLRQSTPSEYEAPTPGLNLLTGYTYPNQPPTTPTTVDYSQHYYKGAPIVSFGPADAGSITLTLSSADYLQTIYSLRIPNNNPVFSQADGTVEQSDPTYNYATLLDSRTELTGCALDLYNASGIYTETVTVVNNTSTATSTMLQVTPLNNAYAPLTTPTFKGDGLELFGPPSAGAAGYAVIHQVGYYDPQGVEVDAEAIQAGTGTQIDATNSTNFSIPTYIAGADDIEPYSAQAAPTDPANGNAEWVHLTPSGIDDGNGGVLYEGTWTTPETPSDWYIDAIAYDNANGNINNDPNAANAVNWRIYDNVWGFSTYSFVAHTNPGGILLVNDYMLPQKFLSPEGISAGNAPVSDFGAESYLTDIDTDSQSAGNEQQLASLPDVGFTSVPNLASGFNITLSILYHRPSEFGFSNTPVYPNGLGVDSYTDGQQNQVAATITAPTYPLQSSYAGGNSVISAGKSTGYTSNTPNPPSQQYDIWRILCRGPVPASILNDYSPTVTQQRADVTDNQPIKKILTSPSCVIWSAPLAGEEFADNGTIADPNTESLLEAFVNGSTYQNISFQGGGRLFVEGTNVGFATNANSSFYSGLLGATYGGETNDNTPDTFQLKGNLNQTDYISNDAYVNSTGDNVIGLSEIGHGNFKATESGTAFNTAVQDWTYEPPALSATTSGVSLQLAFLLGTTNDVNDRSDASLIDGGSGLSFVDTFANSLTTATAAPTSGLLPQTTVEYRELSGSSSADGLSYTAFAPSSNVDFGGGIVAYSSFGLESVSQNVRQVATLLDANGAKPPDITSFTVDNQRSDLLHNMICFLRTGSIAGIVTTSTGSNPTAPLGNAVVSAVLNAGGGVSTPNVTYTGVSDTFTGRFRILGLPPGKYSLTAYAPGYSFTQVNGTGVYVHGGDIGNDNITAFATQPGSLSVTVDDAVTGNGISNVTVTAYEAGNFGQAGDVSFTGVTNSTGTATINAVTTGTYVIVATPPTGSTYSATVYGESGTTPYTPVTVSASNTTSVTVKLNAAGASISGTVTNAAGTAISGATVTLTNTSSTGISPTAVTTAADGTYSFTDVQPGAYTPAAAATGYGTDTLANLTVVSGQAVTGENFTLTPPQFGTIEGAVDDANGNLISGVTVTLTSNSTTAQSATTGSPFADATTPANSDNVEFTNVVYGTYTITAVSSLGNVTETVTLSSPDATFPTIQLPAVHAFTYPAGDAVNTLQMISAPYDYTDTGYTLSELFGYTNPKITTWEPAINQYATPGVSPADTLHLGIGYWVRFPASENLLLAGTPTTANTFPIPLTQGWNMIGEPFVGANVPVSSLQVTVGKQTYSFTDASSQQLQLIGSTLYTYAPGDSAYESITASGTINKYQGYWIHALTPVTLVLTRP